MELFYREVSIESIQEFSGIASLYSNSIRDGYFEDISCSEIIEYLFLDGSYASFKLSKDLYKIINEYYEKVKILEDNYSKVSIVWGCLLSSIRVDYKIAKRVEEAARNAYCRRVLATFEGRSLDMVLSKNYYGWFEGDPFIRYLREVVFT